MPQHFFAFPVVSELLEIWMSSLLNLGPVWVGAQVCSSDKYNSDQTMI